MTNLKITQVTKAKVTQVTKVKVIKKSKVKASIVRLGKLLAKLKSPVSKLKAKLTRVGYVVLTHEPIITAALFLIIT